MTTLATPHPPVADRHLLLQLAEACGISCEFWDWRNEHRSVSDESLVAVLQALDVDASTEESACAALVEHENRIWARLLPPVTVMEQGQAGYVDAHVYAGWDAHMHVRLEDGGIEQLSQVNNATPDREINEQWYGEATFEIPGWLPLGYHRIVIRSGDREADAALIVTPSWLGLPSTMRDKRIWGYATQFYSVRSQESWGIGDFQDLADLSVWAKTQQNAGYVLVNPVHTSNPVPPLEPSPYLPASRRYLNPLYIRVETIPEYARLPEKKRERIASIKKALVEKLPTDAIDRDTIWVAKIKALRIVYAQGLSPARQMAFDDFRRKEGRQLTYFATWCALASELGTNWRSWPVEYQRPSSPDAALFAAKHHKRIMFYCWLQWIVDTQMSQAQLAAKDVGMPVGIINDLAVGVSPDGADAWALADVFAEGMEVGAPPDAFNQQGQTWAQPPWRPDRLAELGYAPFRQMVSGLLRHSGGLRIDHVMGMFRLWWVPQGMSPQDGTYVRYNHEAMVGVLALEAHRAGALVVGEDLGTVEPWVRDYLRRRGVLGTSILWFEYDHENKPLEPQWWREFCMASVTTHDLPPTLGYLAGDHVRLRSELGLLTVSLDEELAYAQRELRSWLHILRDREFLGPEETDPTEIMLALHRYIAATPAKVLCVALVDAVGDRRTQNQPGTSDEYPNWRVPLSGPDGNPVLLEDVFTCERATRLAAVMNGWEQR